MQVEHPDTVSSREVRAFTLKGSREARAFALCREKRNIGMHSAIHESSQFGLVLVIDSTKFCILILVCVTLTSI